MTPRPPSLGSFRIFDACRRGMFLLADNAAYLARFGAVPFLVSLANIALVAGFAESAALTPFSGYLLLLPAEIMMAWMLFIALRLWVLGERADDLPEDPAYRAERRRLMQATIFVYLLINMALSVTEFVFRILLGPDLQAKDPGAQGAAMLVMGIMFWAIRFNLLPALAAVGYSMKRYALQANGILLSFRIMALILLCAQMPHLVVWSAAEEIMGRGSIAALAVTQAAGFVFKLWLFAAFTVALRQMTGGEKPA